MRDEADPQNWLRGAVSTLHNELMNRAWDSDDSGATPISTVLTALSQACMNPEHFGGHKPGTFNFKGNALLPDPTFTWFDLWSYGTSSESGTPGFNRSIGIPESTKDLQLLIATGLLLLADAIDAIDRGNVSFAGYLVYEAGECWHDIDLMLLKELPSEDVKVALQRLLSKKQGQDEGQTIRAALGGQAKSEKFFGEAKKYIQQEWQSVGHKYRSKADFAGRQVAHVNETFDTDITPRTISESWLKGL